MSVASLSFAVFVAAVLAVHRVLPGSARIYWLVAASYVFAATCSPRAAIVLGVLTVVNFAVAARITPKTRGGRAWLWVGLALNLLPIVLSRRVFGLGIIGVTGLSYYGLQAISHLIDLYRGTLRVRLRPAELALYLGYFPKFVAGPLERPGAFAAQLRNSALTDRDVAAGVTLIVIGMVRKVVIADQLIGFVPSGAFRAPATIGTPGVAYALLGWLFFLYNDFAGYTDIVRGTSALFGIQLSRNFAQPFFASSFGEFWNRWHASLSYWLRDYVYLPLSRAILRRKRSLWNVTNLVVPPLATMLVSGVWHGGTVNMLLWGGLLGSFLLGERLAALRRRPGLRTRGARLQMFHQVRVFVLVAVAFVAFRTGWRTSLEFWQTLVSWPVWEAPAAGLCALVGVSLALDYVQHRSGDELVFLRWPYPVQAGLLAVAITACVLATGPASARTFVYQLF